MQNLLKQPVTRLAYLIMFFLCANYGSILAQDEQKAFKEGDKIISFGVTNGVNEVISSGIPNGFYRSAFTPSVTFDYGLKGTRGLLSIGGFASFSTDKIKFGQSSGGYSISPDGYYTTSKIDDIKSATFTTGIRLGIHYATRKWDFYGGLLLGTRITSTEGGTFTTNYYQGTAENPFNKFVKTGSTEILQKNTTNFFLSPYVGAKYYVTKKVSLNIEAGQYTGNVGLGFKF
ncbi:MAG: hypothetical protein V4585_06195 [Bacteroidota bacterium]|jgi:hypothetical protein